MRRQIVGIGEDAGAEAVAVAYYDYLHETEWRYQADRWFHAASTIKIPVLLGVYAAIDKGKLQPFSRVHVRNRFLGAADGRPYQVEMSRDSNAAVYAALGRTMQVRELAHHMIVTSSNLATNLLIDIVGLDAIQKTLDELRLSGIELKRGVEDIKAWEAGINNRVTAQGLLNALRVIEEQKHFSAESCRDMLNILHSQEFRSGIPAGLPEDARVAHKTGEISTVAHDAGLVYLPDRKAFVVAILTEWKPEGGSRKDTIAKISRVVYEYITEGER